MTLPLGTYSFLPYLRRGLANQISASDFDPGVKVRASMDVRLDVVGDKLDGGVATATLTRTVALFGPGDVVGIERRAIVRVEPRDWITNFEPNCLAHVEFYDEDFPWRYTPAAPDLVKGRLRPWVALVVLAEGEFDEGVNVKDRPLPYIEVADLGVFPKAEELWAWAHVHLNRSLAASDDEFVSRNMDAVMPRLAAVLAENSDLAYSRVVCPRKLAEDTAYHAFLVPTFEAGRRAGLGLDLGDVPATMSAWDAGTRPEGPNFPYYHRWFFRTGTSGDFETLVRLLQPKPVDPRVGTREMDVQFPAPNVRGVDNPALGGILKLGGALRPPHPVPPPPPDVFETWDQPFPRPLQEDLAGLINLPDDYQRRGEPDPIVAPPLYGRWHALTSRVLTAPDGSPLTPNDNWVHRLNLDPRFRVPAGFGTRVVQDQQETFMDAAWEQVGAVLDAQRRIRLGQFGVQVSDVWYRRHLTPLVTVSEQKGTFVLAPLNRRILVGGKTIAHTLREGLVQPTMTSTALRRVVRPRGRLITSLPFDATKRPDQLVERVNRAEVSAAPPKIAPAGALTTGTLAGRAAPSDAPAAILDLLRRFPQLPTVLRVIAFVVALLLLIALVVSIVPVVALIAAIVVAVAAAIASWRLSRWLRALRTADAISDASHTTTWVDSLPGAAGFVVSEPGGAVPRVREGPDSVEAVRFKTALRDAFGLEEVGAAVGQVPVRRTLDIAGLTASAVNTISPSRTIPARIRAGIFVPPRITAEIGDAFVEPMAYPVIDLPMYEPLKNLSSELFLPNINLIEPNSITLLETNQRFIESYMVGLNHEFARELLWREYPTDQRGSTFRQFWDVRGFFNADNVDDAALKEQLRDIPPLHTWALASALGTHDNREQGVENEEELVLVIRGELLKRYPTAVIYAHRACWQRKDDGTPADLAKDPCFRSGAIDNTRERRFVPLTEAEEERPPRSKVLTPLYEAKIDPDIYFFGFDLTVEEARGGTGEQPTDDPGWFFVIKERPGEPRFGLDTEQQPVLNVWNDLSWPDVQPQPPGSFIDIAAAPAAFPLSAPGVGDEEKSVQFQDDRKITWSHDMSAAELAYILFQAPVLVGVHAAEMLRK